MTLNEIAYNIADLAGKTDVPHFIERVKFNILYYRALLLRRDEDRNSRIPEQFLQSMCVPMEQVNASDCSGVSSDCNIMRSVDRIPNPVHIKRGNAFIYVGSVDNEKSYAPTTTSQLPYIQYSTFTANHPLYYIQDWYLYVVNSISQTIRVKGVFEDPRKLEVYNCEGEKFDDDSRFPCTADMVQRITASLVNGELQLVNNIDDGNEVNINA